jgi:hypothetical protein
VKQTTLPGVPLPTTEKDEHGVTREHRTAVTDFMVWLYGEPPRSAARHWTETGEWLGEDQMQLRLVEGMARQFVQAEARGAERALVELLGACLSDGITFEDDEVAALRRKLGLKP